MNAKTILTIVFALSAGLASADVMKFTVDDLGGRNVAGFTSKAPIENIVGTTNAVTGYVTFDPMDLSIPVKCRITVDLTKVTTGINLRDEHMRSADYLNTAAYPEAVLVLDGKINAKAALLTDGKPLDLTFKGEFTVHGVTKTVEIRGKATYLKEVAGLVEYGYPGDMLNFDGNFTIKLSDYGIKIPQLLVLKLADETNVNVNFTATTGR